MIGWWLPPRAICVVSTSEKKYWNLKSHGPAGEASGRSRNKDADVWRAWVRQEITRLIETNPVRRPETVLVPEGSTARAYL